MDFVSEEATGALWGTLAAVVTGLLAAVCISSFCCVTNHSKTY